MTYELQFASLNKVNESEKLVIIVEEKVPTEWYDCVNCVPTLPIWCPCQHCPPEIKLAFYQTSDSD